MLTSICYKSWCVICCKQGAFNFCCFKNTAYLSFNSFHCIPSSFQILIFMSIFTLLKVCICLLIFSIQNVHFLFLQLFCFNSRLFSVSISLQDLPLTLSKSGLSSIQNFSSSLYWFLLILGVPSYPVQLFLYYFV